MRRTIGKITENYEKFLFLCKDADPGIPEVRTLTKDAKKRLAGLRELPSASTVIFLVILLSGNIGEIELKYNHILIPIREKERVKKWNLCLEREIIKLY